MQKMQNERKHYAIFMLFIFAHSCAGKNFSDRQRGSSDSSHENNNSQGIVKPSDETVAPAGYQNAHVPMPINGLNLVEILVSASCVRKPNSPCREVRLGAKFRVDSKEAVYFGSDAAGPYGIKSYSWEFRDLAPEITCQSLAGGFAFNPLCTSSSGSLAEVPIKATLSLVVSDDTVFKGDSPDRYPNPDVVQGNFMLLDGSPGLTPTGKTVNGDTAATAGLQLFTQIWAVLKGNEPYLDSLKNVSYVTNFLHYWRGPVPGPPWPPDSTTDWTASVDLCRNRLNSGDGPQWRLPTVVELCGLVDVSAGAACDGGFYGHGIENATFSGGDWNSALWSSTEESIDTSRAWGAEMITGTYYDFSKTEKRMGVICVR